MTNITGGERDPVLFGLTVADETTDAGKMTKVANNVNPLIIQGNNGISLQDSSTENRIKIHPNDGISITTNTSTFTYDATLENHLMKFNKVEHVVFDGIKDITRYRTMMESGIVSGFIRENFETGLKGCEFIIGGASYHAENEGGKISLISGNCSLNENGDNINYYDDPNIINLYTHSRIILIGGKQSDEYNKYGLRFIPIRGSDVSIQSGEIGQIKTEAITSSSDRSINLDERLVSQINVSGVNESNFSFINNVINPSLLHVIQTGSVGIKSGGYYLYIPSYASVFFTQRLYGGSIDISGAASNLETNSIIKYTSSIKLYGGKYYHNYDNYPGYYEYTPARIYLGVNPTFKDDDDDTSITLDPNYPGQLHIGGGDLARLQLGRTDIFGDGELKLDGTVTGNLHNLKYLTAFPSSAASSTYVAVYNSSNGIVSWEDISALGGGGSSCTCPDYSNLIYPYSVDTITNTTKYMGADVTVSTDVTTVTRTLTHIGINQTYQGLTTSNGSLNLNQVVESGDSFVGGYSVVLNGAGYMGGVNVQNQTGGKITLTSGNLGKGKTEKNLLEMGSVASISLTQPDGLGVDVGWNHILQLVDQSNRYTYIGFDLGGLFMTGPNRTIITTTETLEFIDIQDNPALIRLVGASSPFLGYSKDVIQVGSMGVEQMRFGEAVMIPGTFNDCEKIGTKHHHKFKITQSDIRATNADPPYIGASLYLQGTACGKYTDQAMQNITDALLQAGVAVWSNWEAGYVFTGSVNLKIVKPASLTLQPNIKIDGYGKIFTSPTTTPVEIGSLTSLALIPTDVPASDGTWISVYNKASGGDTKTWVNSTTIGKDYDDLLHPFSIEDKATRTTKYLGESISLKSKVVDFDNLPHIQISNIEYEWKFYSTGNEDIFGSVKMRPQVAINGIGIGYTLEINGGTTPTNYSVYPLKGGSMILRSGGMGSGAGIQGTNGAQGMLLEMTSAQSVNIGKDDSNGGLPYQEIPQGGKITMSSASGGKMAWKSDYNMWTLENDHNKLIMEGTTGEVRINSTVLGDYVGGDLQLRAGGFKESVDYFPNFQKFNTECPHSGAFLFLNGTQRKETGGTIPASEDDFSVLLRAGSGDVSFNTIVNAELKLGLYNIYGNGQVESGSENFGSLSKIKYLSNTPPSANKKYLLGYDNTSTSSPVPEWIEADSIGGSGGGGSGGSCSCDPNLWIPFSLEDSSQGSDYLTKLMSDNVIVKANSAEYKLQTLGIVHEWRANVEETSGSFIVKSINSYGSTDSNKTGMYLNMMGGKLNDITNPLIGGNVSLYSGSGGTSTDENNVHTITSGDVSRLELSPPKIDPITNPSYGATLLPHPTTSYFSSGGVCKIEHDYSIPEAIGIELQMDPAKLYLGGIQGNLVFSDVVAGLNYSTGNAILYSGGIDHTFMTKTIETSSFDMKSAIYGPSLELQAVGIDNLDLPNTDASIKLSAGSLESYNIVYRHPEMILGRLKIKGDSSVSWYDVTTATNKTGTLKSLKYVPESDPTSSSGEFIAKYNAWTGAKTWVDASTIGGSGSCNCADLWYPLSISDEDVEHTKHIKLASANFEIRSIDSKKRLTMTGFSQIWRNPNLTGGMGLDCSSVEIEIGCNETEKSQLNIYSGCNFHTNWESLGGGDLELSSGSGGTFEEQQFSKFLVVSGGESVIILKPPLPFDSNHAGYGWWQTLKYDFSYLRAGGAYQLIFDGTGTDGNEPMPQQIIDIIYKQDGTAALELNGASGPMKLYNVNCGNFRTGSAQLYAGGFNDIHLTNPSEPVNLDGIFYGAKLILEGTNTAQGVYPDMYNPSSIKLTAGTYGNWWALPEMKLGQVRILSNSDVYCDGSTKVTGTLKSLKYVPMYDPAPPGIFISGFNTESTPPAPQWFNIHTILENSDLMYPFSLDLENYHKRVKIASDSFEIRSYENPNMFSITHTNFQHVWRTHSEIGGSLVSYFSRMYYEGTGLTMELRSGSSHPSYESNYGSMPGGQINMRSGSGGEITENNDTSGISHSPGSYSMITLTSADGVTFKNNTFGLTKLPQYGQIEINSGGNSSINASTTGGNVFSYTLQNLNPNICIKPGISNLTLHNQNLGFYYYGGALLSAGGMHRRYKDYMNNTNPMDDGLEAVITNDTISWTGVDSSKYSVAPFCGASLELYGSCRNSELVDKKTLIRLVAGTQEQDGEIIELPRFQLGETEIAADGELKYVGDATGNLHNLKYFTEYTGPTDADTSLVLVYNPQSGSSTWEQVDINSLTGQSCHCPNYSDLLYPLTLEQQSTPDEYPNPLNKFLEDSPVVIKAPAAKMYEIELQTVGIVQTWKANDTVQSGKFIVGLPPTNTTLADTTGMLLNVIGGTKNIPINYNGVESHDYDGGCVKIQSGDGGYADTSYISVGLGLYSGKESTFKLTPPSRLEYRYQNLTNGWLMPVGGLSMFSGGDSSLLLGYQGQDRTYTITQSPSRLEIYGNGGDVQLGNLNLGQFYYGGATLKGAGVKWNESENDYKLTLSGTISNPPSGIDEYLEGASLCLDGVYIGTDSPTLGSSYINGRNIWIKLRTGVSMVDGVNNFINITKPEIELGDMIIRGNGEIHGIGDLYNWPGSADESHIHLGLLKYIRKFDTDNYTSGIWAITYEPDGIGPGWTDLSTLSGGGSGSGCSCDPNLWYPLSISNVDIPNTRHIKLASADFEIRSTDTSTLRSLTITNFQYMLRTMSPYGGQLVAAPVQAGTDNTGGFMLKLKAGNGILTPETNNTSLVGGEILAMSGDGGEGVWEETDDVYNTAICNSGTPAHIQMTSSDGAVLNKPGEFELTKLPKYGRIEVNSGGNSQIKVSTTGNNDFHYFLKNHNPNICIHPGIDTLTIHGKDLGSHFYGGALLSGGGMHPRYRTPMHDYNSLADGELDCFVMNDNLMWSGVDPKYTTAPFCGASLELYGSTQGVVMMTVKSMIKLMAGTQQKNGNVIELPYIDIGLTNIDGDGGLKYFGAVTGNLHNLKYFTKYTGSTSVDISYVPTYNPKTGVSTWQDVSTLGGVDYSRLLAGFSASVDPESQYTKYVTNSIRFKPTAGTSPFLSFHEFRMNHVAATDDNENVQGGCFTAIPGVVNSDVPIAGFYSAEGYSIMISGGGIDALNNNYGAGGQINLKSGDSRFYDSYQSEGREVEMMGGTGGYFSIGGGEAYTHDVNFVSDTQYTGKYILPKNAGIELQSGNAPNLKNDDSGNTLMNIYFDGCASTLKVAGIEGSITYQVQASQSIEKIRAGSVKIESGNYIPGIGFQSNYQTGMYVGNPNHEMLGAKITLEGSSIIRDTQNTSEGSYIFMQSGNSMIPGGSATSKSVINLGVSPISHEQFGANDLNNETYQGLLCIGGGDYAELRLGKLTFKGSGDITTNDNVTGNLKIVTNYLPSNSTPIANTGICIPAFNSNTNSALWLNTGQLATELGTQGSGSTEEHPFLYGLGVVGTDTEDNKMIKKVTVEKKLTLNVSNGLKFLADNTNQDTNDEVNDIILETIKENGKIELHAFGDHSKLVLGCDNPSDGIEIINCSQNGLTYSGLNNNIHIKRVKECYIEGVQTIIKGGIDQFLDFPLSYDPGQIIETYTNNGNGTLVEIKYPCSKDANLESNRPSDVYLRSGGITDTASVINLTSPYRDFEPFSYGGYQCGLIPGNPITIRSGRLGKGYNEGGLIGTGQDDSHRAVIELERQIITNLVVRNTSTPKVWPNSIMSGGVKLESGRADKYFVRSDGGLTGNYGRGGQITVSGGGYFANNACGGDVFIRAGHMSSYSHCSAVLIGIPNSDNSSISYSENNLKGYLYIGGGDNSTIQLGGTPAITSDTEMSGGIVIKGDGSVSVNDRTGTLSLLTYLPADAPAEDNAILVPSYDMTTNTAAWRNIIHIGSDYSRLLAGFEVAPEEVDPDEIKYTKKINHHLIFDGYTEDENYKRLTMSDVRHIWNSGYYKNAGSFTADFGSNGDGAGYNITMGAGGYILTMPMDPTQEQISENPHYIEAMLSGGSVMIASGRGGEVGSITHDLERMINGGFPSVIELTAGNATRVYVDHIFGSTNIGDFNGSAKLTSGGNTLLSIKKEEVENGNNYIDHYNIETEEPSLLLEGIEGGVILNSSYTGYFACGSAKLSAGKIDRAETGFDDFTKSQWSSSPGIAHKSFCGGSLELTSAVYHSQRSSDIGNKGNILLQAGKVGGEEPYIYMQNITYASDASFLKLGDSVELVEWNSPTNPYDPNYFGYLKLNDVKISGDGQIYGDSTHTHNLLTMIQSIPQTLPTLPGEYSIVYDFASETASWATGSNSGNYVPIEYIDPNSNNHTSTIINGYSSEHDLTGIFNSVTAPNGGEIFIHNNINVKQSNVFTMYGCIYDDDVIYYLSVNDDHKNSSTHFYNLTTITPEKSSWTITMNENNKSEIEQTHQNINMTITSENWNSSFTLSQEAKLNSKSIQFQGSDTSGNSLTYKNIDSIIYTGANTVKKCGRRYTSLTYDDTFGAIIENYPVNAAGTTELKIVGAQGTKIKSGQILLSTSNSDFNPTATNENIPGATLLKILGGTANGFGLSDTDNGNLNFYNIKNINGIQISVVDSLLVFNDTVNNVFQLDATTPKTRNEIKISGIHTSYQWNSTSINSYIHTGDVNITSGGVAGTLTYNKSDYTSNDPNTLIKYGGRIEITGGSSLNTYTEGSGIIIEGGDSSKTVNENIDISNCATIKLGVGGNRTGKMNIYGGTNSGSLTVFGVQDVEHFYKDNANCGLECKWPHTYINQNSRNGDVSIYGTMFPTITTSTIVDSSNILFNISQHNSSRVWLPDIVSQVKPALFTNYTESWLRLGGAIIEAGRINKAFNVTVDASGNTIQMPTDRIPITGARLILSATHSQSVTPVTVRGNYNITLEAGTDIDMQDATDPYAKIGNVKIVGDGTIQYNNYPPFNVLNAKWLPETNPPATGQYEVRYNFNTSSPWTSGYEWVSSSHTITHQTHVDNYKPTQLGRFCVSTGNIWRGYSKPDFTDCICEVEVITDATIKANNTNIIGVIVSETEFATHGDVLIKVDNGVEPKLGDLLFPTGTGARVATKDDKMFMCLNKIPTAKVIAIQDCPIVDGQRTVATMLC
jgi:hypothetical protein